GNIDDVDDARIADGDIKMARSLIEKNHVWGAAERHIAEHVTRWSVDREQNAGIASAEKPAGRRIKVQTMGSFGWHHVFLRYFYRLTGINCHDQCRRRDIDEERLDRRVVNRPSGATRHFDFGDALLTPNIDDGRGMRIRNGRIPNVGDH